MDNILIIPNLFKDKDLYCAKKIAGLIQNTGKRVCVPTEYKEYFSDMLDVVFDVEDKLFEIADLAISAGGDGSIIHTARKAALREIPIVGVNLGRLGYLAELECDESDKLVNIINGQYTTKKRMMLSFEIVKSDKSVQSASPALNDVVLTSVGNTNRVVDIEVYAGKDEMFAGFFKGNGIIVSTPTGSTAYALAAGGPIVDPQLECLDVVPICTHSLTARPMLFSGETELKLVNAGRVTINVSADGSDEYVLEPGEYVRIKKSEHTAHFVKVGGSSFYEVLHRKMTDKNKR